MRGVSKKNGDVKSDDINEKKEPQKKLRRGLSFLYGGKMDDDFDVDDENQNKSGQFNDNKSENDEQNNSEEYGYNDVELQDDEQDVDFNSMANSNYQNTFDDDNDDTETKDDGLEVEVDNEDNLNEWNLDDDNDNLTDDKTIDDDSDSELNEDGVSDDISEEMDDESSINSDSDYEELDTTNDDVEDNTNNENYNDGNNELDIDYDVSYSDDIEETADIDASSNTETSDEIENENDIDEVNENIKSIDTNNTSEEIDDVKHKMDNIDNDLKDYLAKIKNNFYHNKANDAKVESVTNIDKTQSNIETEDKNGENSVDINSVANNENDEVINEGNNNKEENIESEEYYGLLDEDDENELNDIIDDNNDEEDDDNIVEKNDNFAVIQERKFLGFEVKNVDINVIKTNPNQPRKIFNEEDLEDLKNSIIQIGLLQPIVLNKSQNSDEYHIIAGERRYRAFILLNKATIPAIVVDLDENKRFEASIIENTQRANLNPIEEASAYKYLIDTFDYTQDDVSQSVQKSRAHVANLLRLLNLPHEVKKYIIDGSLTTGHAKLLVGLGGQALMLAKQVVERGLSVRDLENKIKKIQILENNELQVDSVRKKLLNYDIKTIEQDVNQKLTSLKKNGFGVQITHGKKLGTYKATISFSTRNDIDKFFNSISSDDNSSSNN